MAIANAVKISKVDFMFHLIGFERNLMYNSRRKELYMADMDVVYMYSISELIDLTYEDFDVIARNFWCDMLIDYN